MKPLTGISHMVLQGPEDLGEEDDNLDELNQTRPRCVQNKIRKTVMYVETEAKFQK